MRTMRRRSDAYHAEAEGCAPCKGKVMRTMQRRRDAHHAEAEGCAPCGGGDGGTHTMCRNLKYHSYVVS